MPHVAESASPLPTRQFEIEINSLLNFKYWPSLGKGGSLVDKIFVTKFLNFNESKIFFESLR